MFFYSKTMGASSEPYGVLQILWQALQLPAKTAAFFFPLLVLTLFSSSCVFYANFSWIYPVLMDLVSKLTILLKGPGPGPGTGPEFSRILLEIKSELRQVAGVESIVTLVSFFAFLFLLVATVYIFAMAYSGTSLTPKELLSRVGRRWYQTLVTRLYVVLLTLGFGLLSFMVIGTALLLCDGSKYLTSSGMALSTVAASIFIYLWTRWSMSLVITVVEETWGIGALSWSVELFIGNKKKGWTLTLILMLLKMAIYGVIAFMMISGTTPPPPPPPTPPPPPIEDQLTIGFLAVAASALLDMYAMAVYTVFYYECRKSHGLDETITVEEGIVYTGLPAAMVKVQSPTFP